MWGQTAQTDKELGKALAVIEAHLTDINAHGLCLMLCHQLEHGKFSPELDEIVFRAQLLATQFINQHTNGKAN